MYDCKCLFRYPGYVNRETASGLVSITRRPAGTDVHAIKQPVRVLFVALEDLDILEHLLVHRDLVVVPNRVLAEEIKDDIVGRFKCDMLATQ